MKAKIIKNINFTYPFYEVFIPDYGNFWKIIKTDSNKQKCENFCKEKGQKLYLKYTHAIEHTMCFFYGRKEWLCETCEK